jgi:hypothetical protein
MTIRDYPWTTGMLALLLFLCAIQMLTYNVRNNQPGSDDAYVLVREGSANAMWNYQQLPMKECSWCHRTVNLNRHHVIPQAANPTLRDVPDNLIVLCRDCHFVLGHRCDWKQYNPDVLYICTHFTNVIRSANTRYGLTNEVDSGRICLPFPEISPPNTPENTGFSNVLDESGNLLPGLVHPPAAIDATPILHVTNDVPEKQRQALERILKWNAAARILK